MTDPWEFRLPRQAAPVRVRVGRCARLDSETFLLQPIDGQAFSLALEDWAIWRRWETAFHEGKTPHETHPALPEDARDICSWKVN